MTFRTTKIFFKILFNYVLYKIGISRPTICYYRITSQCNLNCSYCVVHSSLGENKRMEEAEMGTEAAKEAIKRIADFGVAIFEFSGGEPLLRKDIIELAYFAQKNGMYTALHTNGTLLSQKMAKTLSHCFDVITISIFERGDKYTEEKKLKKIAEKLNWIKKDSKLQVGINFVVTNYNYTEIEWAVEFFKDKADFISFLPVHGIKEYLLNPQQAEWVENLLFGLKKKNRKFIKNSKEYIAAFSKFFKGKSPVKKECIAFDIFLWLTPEGNFQGCNSSFSTGNILVGEPTKLLRESRKRKEEISKFCDGGLLAGCGQVKFFFDRPPITNLKNAFIFFKRRIQ